MSTVHGSVLELVGRTPVVKLGRLAPPHVGIYVKLEAANPMGSVKDRLALAIIEDAERRGQLRPGQTVVEASSGNTGIALAMVCARKGYPLVVVMAESFSVERRRLMRFLGARVVLTPAAMKGTGMMRKAEELSRRHGWFLCRQFDNEANPDIHERTTGPEILQAFGDSPPDWFVAGCGTGGTVTGVARALRSAGAATRIAACEPDNAPMLASGTRQRRDAAGQPAESHPAFRPHPMQGWSPDFMPRITETAMDAGLVDRIVPVGGAAAMRCSRDLARHEGIFTGITGGAALAGALQIAKDAAPGTRLLVLLPDTGERYLSTPLFADVHAEMSDEEQAISRSTPNWRFDSPPAAPPPLPAPAQADMEAEQLVDQAITDPDTPVVMFALEWCEFCWSVRRLLQHHGIALRNVDLDSVAWQRDDLGARMRKVLATRTGAVTVPQIFVGGEHVGGATEVVEGFGNGRFQSRLARLGVPFDAGARSDPRSFLPGWLHPR